MGTHRARGFSALEALVAMAVGAVIIGAAFKLFLEDSRNYHAQAQIAEMRQNARSGVEMLARDLFVAGYGLRRAAVAVPIVTANEPGNLGSFSATAITVLVNRRDIGSPLEFDMANAADDLDPEDVVGFAAGQRLLVWDVSGSYEWMTVSQIVSGKLRPAAALSKAYDVHVGKTQMGLIDEVAYRFDVGSLQLQRKENLDPWLVVAENVEMVEFRYFDATGVQIFPATAEARRAVSRIGISVRVRTADRDRTTGRLRTYLLTTDVTPRNLPSI